jgi:hypothetical protein
MQSSSKRLIRLQNGWFDLSLVSGAYCARTTANQYSNNYSQWIAMHDANWAWLNSQGTGAWVSSGTSLATPIAVWCQSETGYGTITLGYPWHNELTQVHSVNRFQFPSTLTGYNITGARLWLESPMEANHDYWYTSGWVLEGEDIYAPSITMSGGLNVRFSASIQAPSFATSGQDVSMTAQLLSDNTWAAIPGVENWKPFGGWALARAPAGAWSYYDLSPATVTFLNSNRDFYMFTNWSQTYGDHYNIGNDTYTYCRSMRGMVLEVYCDFT